VLNPFFFDIKSLFNNAVLKLKSIIELIVSLGMSIKSDNWP